LTELLADIKSSVALLTWQLKTATFDHHPGISAKAGIQYYLDFCWIPALRFAAAGMTKLIVGPIYLTSIRNSE
jgi:hypothetical protein